MNSRAQLTQRGRRKGEIAAALMVRDGDVARLANDPDFKKGFFAGYRQGMQVWGLIQGKAAAANDASLISSYLETPLPDPAAKPERDLIELDTAIWALRRQIELNGGFGPAERLRKECKELDRLLACRTELAARTRAAA
jgi:hypothetical protein